MRENTVKGPGKGDLLILRVDGASRGNPGKAGAGIRIEDAEGKKILEMSRSLGRKTNNEAEYNALILGLREAKRLGAGSVRIFTDSQLMERQVRGVYRVKETHLKALHQAAIQSLEGFSSFQIHFVPREQNEIADRLANLAIDRDVSRKAPPDQPA